MSISNDEEISIKHKSYISVNIIKPILEKLNDNCYAQLNEISVEDIYKEVKKKQNYNKENLDFVI